nr:hypothetical protein [Tanacetum cinerariifolium]
MSSFNQRGCYGCGGPLDGLLCRRCTCEWCENNLRDGFYLFCNSRAGNSFIYDSNPNSFDNPPNYSHRPPHPTYETYSCESCGNDSHFGYDCPPRFPLNFEPEPGYTQNYNSYPHDSPSFPQQYLCCDNCGVSHEIFQCQPMNQNFYNSNSSGFDQSQPPQFSVIYQPPQETSIEILHDQENAITSELAEYINTPGWNRPAFYNNGDDDEEDYTVAVTPDFLITDSLIMKNEHLDTIPETESDEFIKSSVENLVLIPSESEDFSDIESECDMPDCDDSQTTNFSTTSSDDESSHEEVIHEMSFKTYSNPLFDLDEEIIASEFNQIHNEDLDSTSKNDRFDTKSYLLESLLNHDESIPPGIDNDDSNSEGDNLFLERLLHDDPILFPDTLDFSYDLRVFLPFFTYLVTSSILLSSESEDTIFDPSIYRFSSLEPGLSHRCGTFKKFNTHRSHLNESPMEMLFSTCSPMD